jgi:hypothetical protein
MCENNGIVLQNMFFFDCMFEVAPPILPFSKLCLTPCMITTHLAKHHTTKLAEHKVCNPMQVVPCANLHWSTIHCIAHVPYGTRLNTMDLIVTSILAGAQRSTPASLSTCQVGQIIQEIVPSLHILTQQGAAAKQRVWLGTTFC